MRILFLDVDGVLNTRPGSLDEDKLDLLVEIFMATGCLFVVSSSWRTVPRMMQRLARAMAAKGLEVYSTTPELVEEILPWGFAQAVPRHEEIQLWLDANGGGPGHWTSYCILDDDTNADDGSGRYVRTVMEVGLDKAKARAVIETLNRQI